VLPPNSWAQKSDIDPTDLSPLNYRKRRRTCRRERALRETQLPLQRAHDDRQVESSQRQVTTTCRLAQTTLSIYSPPVHSSFARCTTALSIAEGVGMSIGLTMERANRSTDYTDCTD